MPEKTIRRPADTHPLFSCRFSSILKTMILFLSFSARSHRSSFSLPAHRQNMERGTVTRMEAISLHRLLMPSILCGSETPVRRVGPRREEKIREGRNSSNLGEDLQRVFLAQEADDLLHGCLVKQAAVFLINVQIPEERHSVGCYKVAYFLHHKGHFRLNNCFHM